MIDIFEKEILETVFDTFNGNERKWSVKNDDSWSKWFIPNSVSDLIVKIKNYENCELHLSTGRYDSNLQLRYWTMVVDIDLLNGKKDDRIKECEMQKITKLLDKFGLCYLVDSRYHIWIPDWETVLVDDWRQKYNNDYFISSMKFYLEKTAKLKESIIDTNPWRNHLIRAPYSRHLKTNSVQRFLREYMQKIINTEITDDFEVSMKIWNGSFLDISNKLTTFDYAKRFKKFIEVAEEEGTYIKRMMSAEPEFREEKVEGEIRPCLLSLPKNPSHEHRLAFVWEWLNKTSISKEELIEKFRNVSDFDEKKTEYQIEHSMKKKYKPYSCKKLFLYGICLGEKCEKFKRLIKNA